jgi:integrase
MGRHAKPEYEVKRSSVPNGELYWYIIGRPNGVRKRAWFQTKEKAQAEATERNNKLRRLGHDSAKVDNALIVMATEGATRMALHNKTIRDAVDFFEAHLIQLKLVANSVSVSELCRVVREEFDFRLANEGATLRHKRTMDSELKKFEARFGDRSIKTLSGNEIKEWLAGLKTVKGLEIKPKTRMKIFGYIQNAYGIAMQKGLLAEDPFEKVENFMRSKKSEAPAFPLSPEEAQALLDAAEPSVVPFIAVGMFAGLRTSERDLIEWKHFVLDDAEPFIDIPKSISKTGERRLVPIQPALLAFLAPFVKKQGRIIPLTCNGNIAYQNAWERSVKAAGLWPWSENRLRDSFCSYRYRATGSAEMTAEEDGHTVQVMIDRYRKLVTREDAERFWAIRPKAVT